MILSMKNQATVTLVNVSVAGDIRRAVRVLGIKGRIQGRVSYLTRLTTTTSRERVLTERVVHNVLSELMSDVVVAPRDSHRNSVFQKQLSEAWDKMNSLFARARKPPRSIIVDTPPIPAMFRAVGGRQPSTQRL